MNEQGEPDTSAKEEAIQDRNEEQEKLVEVEGEDVESRKERDASESHATESD